MLPLGPGPFGRWEAGNVGLVVHDATLGGAIAVLGLRLVSLLLSLRAGGFRFLSCELAEIGVLVVFLE